MAWQRIQEAAQRSLDPQKAAQQARCAAVQDTISYPEGRTRSMHQPPKMVIGRKLSFMLQRYLESNVKEDPWVGKSRAGSLVPRRQYVSAHFLVRRLVLTKSAPNRKRSNTRLIRAPKPRKALAHWNMPIKVIVAGQSILLTITWRHTQEQSLEQVILIVTILRMRTLLR
jgi:hypothetical protein